jgi:cytochrome c556
MRRFILAFSFTAVCALWAQSSYHEVATTKQLMATIEGPTFGAIGGMSKAGGPKDDKEWAQAQNNAALLAEGAQLLLLGSRPKDQDVWVKTATALSDSSSAAMKAAESKDLEAWKTAVGGIGKSCAGCHAIHRPRPQTAK